jgi:GH24 family phage-related lysozyme (muramidase)
MANPILRKMASEAIVGHEGDVKQVYKDIKGIPTVGIGLNLKSPIVRTYIQGAGINPDDVINGKVQLPEDLAKDIHENMVDRSIGAVMDTFADQGLSNNELAALASLHYNSPSLIGPNLTAALKKGDKVAASKEILLRSNKEKNRGLATRRLQEAKLFGGGKLPDLTPEETMDLRGYFQDMPDTADRRRLFTENPQLNPEQIKTGYPFLKIKRNLYAPMKEQYEVSNSPPEAVFPPVENFGDEFSSPEDKTIPAVTDVTNILDQYDLLKRLK